MNITSSRPTQEQKLYQKLSIADDVLQILALAAFVLGLTGLGIPLALVSLVVKLVLLARKFERE